MYMLRELDFGLWEMWGELHFRKIVLATVWRLVGGTEGEAGRLVNRLSQQPREQGKDYNGRGTGKERAGSGEI